MENHGCSGLFQRVQHGIWMFDIVEPERYFGAPIAEVEGRAERVQLSVGRRRLHGDAYRPPDFHAGMPPVP